MNFLATLHRSADFRSYLLLLGGRDNHHRNIIYILGPLLRNRHNAQKYYDNDSITS